MPNSRFESLIAVVSFLVLFSCVGGVAADRMDWHNLRALLESNAEALSPISIEWECESESPLSESRWNDFVKSWCPQYDVLSGEKTTLSFQGNKFYYLRHYHQARLENNPNQLIFVPGKQLNDLDDENSFNGEAVYAGRPRSASQTPLLRIRPVGEMKARHPDFPYMRALYFNFAGFKLPELAAEVGDIAHSLPSYLIEHGGALIGTSPRRFDGVDCTTVTIDHGKRRHDFYLDPAMNYAVRGRVETDEEGHKTQTVSARDFHEFRHSLWLPHQVKVASFAPADIGGTSRTFEEPFMSSTYTVRNISGAPISEERFTLSYTAPGTWVSDARLPGAYDDGNEGVQYVIPADERMLDEAIENAQSGSTFVPSKRTAWYAVIAVILGCAVAVGARRLLARRRTLP